jgi:hypothetical protein
MECYLVEGAETPAVRVVRGLTFPAHRPLLEPFASDTVESKGCAGCSEPIQHCRDRSLFDGRRWEAAQLHRSIRRLPVNFQTRILARALNGWQVSGSVFLAYRPAVCGW